MIDILVLVDFTETADRSVAQAISIAMDKGGKITVCHIAGSKTEDEATTEKLKPYLQVIEKEGISCKSLVGHGNLYKEAASIADHTQPDLIIVGTHGVKGLKQNIFGANIYKLVSGLSIPSLVVNDHARTVKGGYKKVLMPVAHHLEYLNKVKQTSKLIAKDGKIVIFSIAKPGLELDAEVKKNITESQNWLNENGINWEYQEVSSTKYSLGYAKETLAAISDQKIDLISIITNISEQSALFGKMDKENLLVNQIGLQVLCTV
ncbi:MAG: nucleotide-binding universal stress UspA family protein [Limisphaerales bacterium]|jgi:nucleotide-binding universal stress UspA family protein